MGSKKIVPSTDDEKLTEEKPHDPTYHPMQAAYRRLQESCPDIDLSRGQIVWAKQGKEWMTGVERRDAATGGNSRTGMGKRATGRPPYALGIRVKGRNTKGAERFYIIRYDYDPKKGFHVNLSGTNRDHAFPVKLFSKNDHSAEDAIINFNRVCHNALPADYHYPEPNHSSMQDEMAWMAKRAESAAAGARAGGKFIMNCNEPSALGTGKIEVGEGKTNKKRDGPSFWS